MALVQADELKIPHLHKALNVTCKLNESTMLRRFFMNCKVHNVYKYIANNINQDLEFWETKGGFELHHLLMQFSTNDFLSLQSELSYWNETEQNILTDCVAYGLDGKFITRYDEDKRRLVNGLYSKLQNGFRHPKLKKWIKNFRVNSKTKSKNELVKELYDIILRDEYTDTDYWYCVGADDFHAILDQFNESDFQDLVTDIPNWTEDQLYILNECISTTKDVYSKDYRQSKAFEYQSGLLPVLFTITLDDQIKNDIYECTELIASGKPKPLKLLMEMKTWADKQFTLLETGQNGYKPADIHHEFLKQAIEKASR